MATWNKCLYKLDNLHSKNGKTNRIEKYNSVRGAFPAGYRSTSKSFHIMMWFWVNCIKFLGWHDLSQDLNPIEHVWQIKKHEGLHDYNKRLARKMSLSNAKTAERILIEVSTGIDCSLK